MLIAEACNHSRITEGCNDIGSVQIPRLLEEKFKAKGIVVVRQLKSLVLFMQG